ncbi:plasmid partitioning protein RepB [Rhizobiaceae bacterium BDR2-2]|uniref:Plasmid partitioning protein RepB n=1 Tax=Ectorhizobium quercum TaxID=2965071 RepID=A0AAE3N164_9HYPH|nr:plasmid partitioning protein RepB [Ectorhizobium quercum]MCX8998256.1 plasmid partitioning protein RepB [Ectorhizobium quercum]
MAGINRKNELKALFGGSLAPSAPPAAPETKSAPAAPPPPDHSRSGAVKAMGLTLGAMTREAEEARNLRAALEKGERVVLLDPAVVDGSIVEDRLTVSGRTDEDFERLVDSIRESGQQVPILVRPHPTAEGRYQTAYGHRRLEAARRLGIKVQAVVRALSDDALVLAQGKENAERRNLTFIERAFFARTLVSRGFDRKVVGEALAVEKSELSRLLQVAEAVPVHIVRAIGPAPKAGRDRWMALGSLVSSDAGHAKATEEIGFQRFAEADSDKRFQFVFNRLTARDKPKAARPRELADGTGRVFARLVTTAKGSRIEFLPGASAEAIEKAADLLSRHYSQIAGAGE